MARTSKAEFNLTEHEASDLTRLMSYYWKEAERCRKAKAYLAGCAMLASAMEAWLLFFAHCFPDDARNAKHAPNKPLLKWSFPELLNVARDAKWLPTMFPIQKSDLHISKFELGDLLEFVRNERNLIHPARHIQDHHKKRVTKAYLDAAFVFCEGARQFLYARIQRDLKELDSTREEFEEFRP